MKIDQSYYDFSTLASSLDQIKMTKKRLEFDKNNWQWQTLTLELDQNFTTTNINFLTWPKYSWIWLKIKYIINITTTMKVNRGIWPKIKIRRWLVIFCQNGKYCYWNGDRVSVNDKNTVGCWCIGELSGQVPGLCQ